MGGGEGRAALVGLDWGTSSLRALLLAADGAVLATASAAVGLAHVHARARRDGIAPQAVFAAELRAVTGSWEAYGGLPVLACGMVGSAQGWAPTPYLDVPVDLDALAGALTTVSVDAGEIHLVPGLRTHGPSPELARGEETQLLGLVTTPPGAPPGILRTGAPDTAVAVLPGTHTKWARTQGRVVTDLRTAMVGELHAALRTGSIGRFAPAADGPGTGTRWAAFERGLDVAHAADAPGLLTAAFSARSLVLTGALEPADVDDYLSGLLIGEDVARTATGWLRDDREVLVTGEPTLAERYVRACTGLGLAAVAVPDPVSRGFARIAAAAGLTSDGDASPAPPVGAS